jgi:hypothetical protein
MTPKSIILAIAATCGLAAQSPATRLTAAVPFPFDFQGKAMTAGNYEIIRGGSPNTITVRNLTTGATFRSLQIATDQKPAAANGFIFEKADGAYFFRSFVDEGTATAYHVGRTRRQMESARNHAPEKVYIAAR